MAELTPEQLAKLRQYSAHQELLCLQCGYQGLHGVIKTHRKGIVSTVVLILLFILLADLLVAIVATVMLVWAQNRKESYTLDCTNCGEHIATR